MQQPFLSAALLACNDESWIARTLDSLRDTVDEIIVVLDGKSEDRTFDLVEKFGLSWDLEKPLQIHERAWTHSYSEARNRAAELCTGKWVMVLDADEELAPGAGEDILEALRKDEYDTYTCPFYIDATYETPTLYHEGFGDFCSLEFRNRIFRNELKPRYRYRVHEQPYFETTGTHAAPDREDVIDAAFYHRGKFNSGKSDYYQALLTLDSMEYPEHPVPFIYRAELALKEQRQERAAQLLNTIDPDSIPEPVVQSRWYVMMGKIKQLLYSKAKSQFEMENRPLTQADLDSHQAIANESIDCFQKAWELSPTYNVAGIQAAVMLVISKGLEGVQSAAGVLAGICESDPDNVMARELLQFLVDFLKSEQENVEGDRDVLKVNYQQLITRLGVYLSELNVTGKRARMKADGIDPVIEPVRMENMEIKTVAEDDGMAQLNIGDRGNA